MAFRHGLLRSDSVVTVLGGPVPVEVTEGDTADGFTASTDWELRDGTHCQYYDVTLQVWYEGDGPVERGLQVRFALEGSGRPNWLVPGAFYKENRLPQCTHMYPRYDWEGGDPQQLVSDTWSFRADRAALPAVFAWNEDGCVGLATAETSAMGICGMGFSGNAEGTYVWLNFPYREEPAMFAEPGHPAPVDCPLYRWEPGETMTLHFRVYAGWPEPHAYNPFVRELYAIHRTTSALNPWMGLRQAAELTAHGLCQWHSGGGGAPYAHALLMYGRKHGRADYVEAGLNVLNQVASGAASAEDTLFLVRALAAEQELGVVHPDWREAVLTHLRHITAHQREDGSYGDGGMLWIAALLEGARLLGDEGFRASALKAGAYYSRFVDDDFICGASLIPTAAAGYSAVMAYVLLYEEDRDERWLRLGARAADWTMTFRWAYNIYWPAHTILAAYDFRSRGADLASPCDQYLQNYGLICLPEMLRLHRYTGDAYYLERTRDNLACFLQFIARADGDFNAYKGMVAERYYNTRCFELKGMLRNRSHARSVGATLYAVQAALAFEAELQLPR
ncbi:MAG TPA: hypothetical protein VD902_11065 [Symbiobacteriaceae bacterium]|nr:hypothetical protein [Symbiobacteriaceae bacterium]